MSSAEITIIKRDGSRKAFSVEKIKNAIRKAFLSVGAFATEEDLVNILSHVRITEGMSVEEIQNQVEVGLMAEQYFAVAKSFMLYRQRHSEDREVRDHLDFLIQYCQAENAATGSKYDANANIEKKNLATLIGELPKKNFIRLNRRILTDRMKKMYGKELSDKYIRLLKNHHIYKNDETSLANYCASITMYPWLLEGTKPIGGNSIGPTNLKSFCGGFINLVFMVSSMLSGACATPEFLMYMNYFVGKEYGKDYWKHPDFQADNSAKKRTIDKVITDCFEQIVYSINQPTGARNFQAVFWNISYYDKNYFESIFGEFRFPDGSAPDWEGLSWLQKRFMKWFNAERLKTPLTFPVETMALLTENNEVKDKEWGDFTAEMYSEGHSFFTYMSDNADSLASCCRLRNEIQDNGFSYTLGAGGVSTGSKSVLTINLNRCIQYAVKNGRDYMTYLAEVVDLVHKVQLAYDENLKALKEQGMLPLFDAGFINIGRQYLTVGINGLVEAAEFLGIEINDNPAYVEFVQNTLANETMELTIPLTLSENQDWEPGKHYIYTIVFGLDEILINPSVADWEDVVVEDKPFDEAGDIATVATEEELKAALEANVAEIELTAEIALTSQLAVDYNVAFVGGGFSGSPIAVTGGVVSFENVAFANGNGTDETAVYVRNGNTNVTFQNCTFDAYKWEAIQYTSEDGLWVCVDGCTFEAAAHRDLHLQVKNASKAEVKITNNKFNGEDADSYVTVYGFDKERMILAGNETETPANTVNVWISDLFDVNDLTLDGFVEATQTVNTGASTILNADVATDATIALGGNYLDGKGNALTATADKTWILTATGGNYIKNLDIDGAEYASVRGIVLTGNEADVVINNVHVSNTLYPLNTSITAAAQNKIIVVDSSLRGWTSYDSFESALFLNTYFGFGKYGHVKPYITTVFENCTFEKGMTIDYERLEGTLTFKNCNVDGVVLTAENVDAYLQCCDYKTTAWENTTFTK